MIQNNGALTDQQVSVSCGLHSFPPRDDIDGVLCPHSVPRELVHVMENTTSEFLFNHLSSITSYYCSLASRMEREKTVKGWLEED